MKYLDEFRGGEDAQKLVKAIHNQMPEKELRFMEVCGTHTMSIARYGIRELLPRHLKLISGPGCPVCVTAQTTLDSAIALAHEPDVIITTFGDMMKVPGSKSSLDLEHAGGASIRVVTSTLESLALAKKHPDNKIVFLGVGFETTIPTVAAAITGAEKAGLTNFYVLAAHKVMPPAMEALSKDDTQIDGYICPGHVSTIIGSYPYKPLAEKYGIACVVSGFEPLDILQSVLMMIGQLNESRPSVEIQYSRAVKPEGNPTAVSLINTVFEPCDSIWRGIGNIPGSGLKIRENYRRFDAEKQFDLDVIPVDEPKGCLCGTVLQGKAEPTECGHFGKSCNPDHPVGPCMVSSEGTCAAYYRYYRVRD